LRRWRSPARNNSQSLSQQGCPNGITQLRDRKREAASMLKIAKDVGVSFQGSDDAVIRRFLEPEQKDKELL